MSQQSKLRTGAQDQLQSARGRRVRNLGELKFHFEPLEPRLMLSGNVIATIVGGDILIQGDALDNEISIEFIEDDVVLVGDSQTTINGSADNFVLFNDTSQVRGDIRVDLKAGDDSFAVRDGIQIEQSVMLFTGTGNNSVGLGEAKVGRQLNVITGDGSNTVALNGTEIGGDLRVRSGAGDDVVSILNSTISDDIHLRTGHGNDGILIESSRVGGNAKAITQRGNDDFVIRNSEIAGNVVSVMGAGDDFHCIEPSTIGGKTIVVMNSGDDEVIYIGENVFNGKQIVIGGSGWDHFEVTTENRMLNGQISVSNESDDVPKSTTDFRLQDTEQGLFPRSIAAQAINENETEVAELTISVDTSANTTIQSNDVVITKAQPFLIKGTTAAGAEVAIDLDNDGTFDDGSTTADASGSFSLTVALVNNHANLGLNEIRIVATGEDKQVATTSISVHYALGSVVRFESKFGSFDVELSPDADLATTVENFLSYETEYENSVLHRSATTIGGAPFVIQGGGYRIEGGDIVRVDVRDAIPNQFEAENSNLRGTIAMALPEDNLNGATSQWFINLADGNASLDASSFTVFGRVIGSGMTVVETLYATPVSNIAAVRSDAALFEVPLTGYQQFTRTISGTVSLTAGQASVTGTGTKFLAELVPHAEIEIEGVRYGVESILSETELVLQSAALTDAVGVAGLINDNPDLEDFLIFNSIGEIAELDSDLSAND